jgi:Predicted dehydrogenases and related proteins
MAKRELKYGIIGCGMIAGWHARASYQIEGLKLVGAADEYANAVIAFAREHGIKAFESVDELLSDKDIDVVSICTPSGLHAQLAVKAANSGKHILIEKPMAITIKECDEILEACDRNNVKMAVISQLRFSSAVSELKSAVDNGLLGRLVTGDIYMKYYRSQEYYDKGGWRGTWRMDGGGALMNQGIHGVDLLQYIMGPVKSVFAHTRTLVREIEVEDTATAVLEFSNGALGIIQGTTSIYPGSPRRLEICGDKGTIVVIEDSISQWNIEGQPPRKDLSPDGPKTATSSNPGAFGIEGHTKQLSDMVQAIWEDRRPMVDQHEGKKPVEIILAIYESSKTGKPVFLKHRNS